jgi:hypothetical protein
MGTRNVGGDSVKKTFALKDVVNSPFRDFKINPLREVALSALDESFDTVGFWENIIGREVKGKLELILGHHRTEMLRRKYKSSDTFTFNVVKKTDAEVLQMMARDHDDSYDHDLADMMERIKFSVQALAEGKIPADKWPAPEPRAGNVCQAPSFIPGRPSSPQWGDHPYTAVTLARFLGATKKKGTEPKKIVVAALNVLRLEEMKIWDTDVVQILRKENGISVDAVMSATTKKEVQSQITQVREAEKAQREAEQRKSEAQRAAEAKAEAEKAQRELDKIAAHKAKALTEKLEAQRKQDIADAEQRVADAKAKADEAKRDWDAGEAERKKAKLQAERAAVAETARKEGRRASHVKSIVEKVERVLVDDSLYELIRDLKKTTALTPAERKNLKTALQDAGVRFREHASKF